MTVDVSTISMLAYFLSERRRGSQVCSVYQGDNPNFKCLKIKEMVESGGTQRGRQTDRLTLREQLANRAQFLYPRG